MRIELRHIHKHFGPVHANDDVSLTVEAGSIHGLLGENGAGKSTLAKVLTGYITRDAGDILLDGARIDVHTPADAIRAGVGMLHQDPLDFPPLTVTENFLAATLGGATEADFLKLAAQFNFILDPNALVADLSVGERQQLEIVRLLAMGVRALILDEPTTGISASQKSALFVALRRLAETGKSVIFVSHKLEDVEQLCDRVTVMRRGRVVGGLDLRRAEAPSALGQQLVSMMFGKALAQPVKPATRRDDVILKLRHIEVVGDRLDVRVDHLDVHMGEVIGLAGLEGSGQRQLLELCAGLLRPRSGAVEIGGRALTRRPYRHYLASGATYLPADRLRDGLIAGLTIEDHVAIRESVRDRGGRGGLFVNRAAGRRAAATAIEVFNIKGEPATRVERLSGGNQQRAQLALMPPDLKLILMEHPTRGLDMESTVWVWQQLIARCQRGAAIVFASADLDEVVQYSDRVVVFSGGRASDAIDASSLTAGRLGEMIGGRF